MQNIDLKNLTSEELDQLRIDILNEQERRQRLLDIPAQVKQLVGAYETSGGDRAQLVSEIVTPHERAEQVLPGGDSSDTIQDEQTNQETNENGTTESTTST